MLEQTSGHACYTFLCGTDCTPQCVSRVPHLNVLISHAPVYPCSLPYEHIYQVIFPERAGALKEFLSAISPRWNVTLFHYRNTGNRESSVLLGVQVGVLLLILMHFHLSLDLTSVLWTFASSWHYP